MNQNNWEKAKSEAAASAAAIYGVGTIYREDACDIFEAGADFGRAYSQGEIALLKVEYDILKDDNSSWQRQRKEAVDYQIIQEQKEQIDQLTKQNEELKSKYEKAVESLKGIADNSEERGRAFANPENVRFTLRAAQVLKELGEI